MADPRHRLAPGRFGYMEKTDFGMLPGELMPSWLRQIIDPGLQRIIEAGGDFASWIEGKRGEGVFPKLEQPMVYGIDPATGKATAAGGTYAVEEPFKDVEFAGANWYGKADLVINRGGNQVQVGDFKVKKRWNPTELQAEADKYLPQLSSYHHLHKAKYPSIGVAEDVATIYVSQQTAKFLRAAFDAGAINSQQLLDEMASTGTETNWRTDTEEFDKFKSGYSGDSSRQVLFHQAKVMSEEELKPYIQAELDFSKAIEAATGHSRTELGSAFKKYGKYATPTAEDVPFWTEWYESLNYLASRYAAGQVTIGQVERGMARVQDRHGYGGARRFDDVVHESLSKKPAQGEERVVDRYNQRDELRNWKHVSDIIPGIPAGTPGMENVRVNPETREIAIVYDDGSDFLSEYWRGQYDILPGNKVVIDGRLITPRQMDSPNPLVPSARWETAANVLPRVLRTASALVPALGGGSKAAKEVRNYMLRALEPMPSVGQDLLSVSAARMAYQASMVGILSDQYTAGQVESVLRASGGTYAWRGQGRQAFDVAEYAHIPGWSYNPETGVMYAGAKPGKIEKRARQGLRHELMFPVTRGASIPLSPELGTRKYTTTLDTSKMMFSPIVQRDKRGRASEYGAELGYRARAAVLGHSDILPQGMAYTKGGKLGGVINRTIEIPAAADFTPLESIIRNEAGEVIVGHLNDDERTPIILPLEGLDDFELMETKLTRSGHSTRIDIKGLGSVKASSNLAKVWLGEKTMLAQANLAKMIGDPLARGADVLLPRRKNIRQFAYQLVSAAYAKDPIGLAHKIYGEGNLKGNIAIGMTDREKALQGQYGIEHSGISVLMPVEEEHQKAFYRVAIEEATKGLRENVQLRTPLSETTRLMFESANIPMRRMEQDEIVQAGGVAGKPWYEIGVPAIYSELFMQTGIERAGDPQMSFEEIMNLVQDPSGYGEGYQKSVQEKVLPQLAKWSGHARSVYHDVLKARMLSLRETSTKPSADEIVTIEQLKDQLGDHDRSNLALRLKEATGLHGKLIQVGNMYLPPAETLAALSVVEDFKQNMPWVEGEEGEQLGIKAEQVGSLLSSLHNFLMRGNGRDYMSLREAFLGTGMNEKLGVGMTQALARGTMGAKLLRGAAERPVVSYDWLEDNQVLIGDKDLQRMFGPKFDLTKLNDALAVAGVIRRPITNVGRGGILAAQIVTTSQARERGLDVPDDFDGVATSRYIINQLSGDFDADRIFALLMSSMASSGEEFSTDPTIQKAATLASLYSREAKDLASQMGYKSIGDALGRQVDEASLKPEDVFDLNLMYGRKYSEMAKSHEDLSEEQKVFADLVNKGARGLATGVLGTEDEWMQRAPVKETVDAILGSTHSQMEMQRGYNRLIRDVPAYMALTGVEAGSEEGQLQRLVAFRAYQQAVDKTLFSSGIREWMNLAEGYNPYRLQGRTYIKRLGPATPKGELKGEHLELMSSKGGFNVRAIQSILESKEYWGPMRTEGEEALREEKGIRAWAGETEPEIVAQQKAMAITSNKGMQAQIVQALMREEGASAQQVWELFGETGQERFANLWRDPGVLAGPLGALVFAGMRRSAGQPVQPYMRERGTAQQHERNMLDWGKVIGIAPEALTLARTGESMRDITRGLSGKGRPEDIVKNLRALSESGMYGATSILEALETQPIISRFNPAIGEPDSLLRRIQPGEDEYLKKAADVGLDLRQEDPRATRAEIRRKELKAATPVLGMGERQWPYQREIGEGVAAIGIPGVDAELHGMRYQNSREFDLALREAAQAWRIRETGSGETIGVDERRKGLVTEIIRAAMGPGGSFSNRGFYQGLSAIKEDIGRWRKTGRAFITASGIQYPILGEPIAAPESSGVNIAALPIEGGWIVDPLHGGKEGGKYGYEQLGGAERPEPGATLEGAKQERVEGTVRQFVESALGQRLPGDIRITPCYPTSQRRAQPGQEDVIAGMGTWGTVTGALGSRAASGFLSSFSIGPGKPAQSLLSRLRGEKPKRYRTVQLTDPQRLNLLKSAGFPTFQGPGEPADILGFLQEHEGGLLRTLEGAGWGRAEIKQLGQVIKTIAGAPDIELEDIVGAITAEEARTPEQLASFRATVPALAASKPAGMLARAHMAYGLGGAPVRRQAAPAQAPQQVGIADPEVDPLRQAVLQSGNIDAIESLLRSQSQAAKANWGAFFQAYPERGRGRETYADVRPWVTGEGWDEGKKGFPALAGLPVEQQREEMLKRVARGGLDTDMARTIMTMIPEMFTRAMPGALAEARRMSQAGLEAGPEWEQGMAGVMRLAGVERGPSPTQRAWAGQATSEQLQAGMPRQAAWWQAGGQQNIEAMMQGLQGAGLTTPGGMRTYGAAMRGQIKQVAGAIPGLREALGPEDPTVQRMETLVAGIAGAGTQAEAERLVEEQPAIIAEVNASLEDFRGTLTETTPSVEEFGETVDRFLEIGRPLRPGERREFQRGTMAMRRARGAAEQIALMGETPEERAGARQELARIGAIERRVPRLQQQQEGVTGPGGYPTGPAGAMARGLHQITSGWELMRLQRMWGMTGAPVFQQMIPAAAQEQLAAMQASGAIGGAAPELPGGAGGGVMRYQAARRAASMRAGRIGYQAWEPFMQAAGPVQDIQALLGPAAGAGLVAGGVGTMLGAGALGAGAAATTIGLPVTLVVSTLAALVGGAGYAYRAGAPEAENQLRLRTAQQEMLDVRTGRREADPMERAGIYMRAGWESATTLIGGALRGEEAGYIGRQERAGAAVAAEPLMQLSSSDRASVLSDVAESMSRMTESVYAGFDPEQILKFISSEAAFFPELSEMTGDEIKELFATEEFQNRLASGITGEAVTPIARAAGARPGTEAFQEIRDWFQELPRFEQAQVTREAEQLGPLQQRRQAFGITEEIVPFGVTPEVRTGAIITGTEVQAFREQLAQMTGSVEKANATIEVFGGDVGGMRTFQRIQQGDPWAISRYAGGDMGLFGTAQVRQATAAQFGGEIPPEIAGIMRDLRPIINTQTGLKVGVASFPGFSEQLAEGMRIAARDPGARGAIALPEGGLPDWVQQIIEERGTRGLQVEQIQVQRGYQEWQQGQRGRALDWQRVSQFGGQFEGFGTRGTFAIQRELRNLGRLWADFTTDFQEQQRQLQYSQFMENWQVKAERAPTQFQWQREDLAFKGAQQTMQYGWGQEDIEEALRYATGRERRKLLKQQERATIQYGMGMGQLGVQGERLDVREQWSQEDLEREKRQFLERFALQDEYQSKYRWYMEQRRALEDELQAIHEFGAQFNLEQAEAALAKQIEIQTKLNAINDGFLTVGTTMENIVALAQLFANSSQDALADQVAAAQAQSRAAREAADSYNAMIQTTRQREF